MGSTSQKRTQKQGIDKSPIDIQNLSTTHTDLSKQPTQSSFALLLFHPRIAITKETSQERSHETLKIRTASQTKQNTHKHARARAHTQPTECKTPQRKNRDLHHKRAPKLSHKLKQVDLPRKRNNRLVPRRSPETKLPEQARLGVDAATSERAAREREGGVCSTRRARKRVTKEERGRVGNTSSGSKRLA